MAADLGGPEALLAQIRQMLDAYLAMGPNTPVAQQASALAQAIDATTGGGGMDANAPPPDPQAAAPMMPPGDVGAAPMADMPPGGMPMPEDNTALQEGEQGYSGTSMDDATKGATDFLKNRNKKTKAS